MPSLNGLDNDAIAKIHRMVLKEKADLLRKGEKLNICFFVNRKQFWSMQSIYDSFKKHGSVNLLVVPFPAQFDTPDEKKLNYDDLRWFHEAKGATVVQVCDHTGRLLRGPDELAPDIVFYEQHWTGNYPDEYAIQNLMKTALCICIPYGVMIANIPRNQFNGVAHNLAWRNFVESPVHYGLARKYGDNNGANAVVSGYSKFDALSDPPVKNYWKTSTPRVKRIVWAPHYSVNTGRAIDFSTFAMYWGEFLQLVKNNGDRIEMILKPHPALKYQCVKSGISERTYDQYLKVWHALPNASVVTDGDYMDLFASSDAMLLDSLSFVSEYMITGKPMCFLNKFPTVEELADHLNEYGKKAISLVDMAYDFDDVLNFVEGVCRGTLAEREDRKYFVDNVLKVNFGRVGEFIVNHIMEQLRAA